LPSRDIVHFKHRCGADAIVVATGDVFGGFGVLTLCGTKERPTTVPRHLLRFQGTA
jgi:hypothetical protein